MNRLFGKGIFASSNITACQKEFRRTFLFTFKKIYTIDTYLWLTQPIDSTPEGIYRLLLKKEYESICKSNQFNEKRFNMLGADMSASHFIVANGGSVKYQNHNIWFKKDLKGKIILPMPSENRKVEAIDASNTNFMAIGVHNITGLKELRYLNLSNCKYVDDWCVDKLSLVKHSLRVLDLSGCSNVSERGLACLHRLSNLRRIILHNMTGVEQPKRIAFLLEEALPNCIVEGIDYSDVADEPQTTKARSSLMDQWIGHAKADQMKITNALLNDYESDIKRFEEDVKKID